MVHLYPLLQAEVYSQEKVVLQVSDDKSLFYHRNHQ